MKLIELCEEYFLLNTDIRSEDSRRLMRLSVRHFSAYLTRDADAADLTERNFAGYVHHRRALGKAETTIEREAAKLMTLWRHASLEGHVRQPRIKVRKAQVKAPVGFTRRELRRLFRAASCYPPAIGRRVKARIPGHIYTTALLYALWYGGDRFKATYLLQRRDIVELTGAGWWLPWRGWIVFRERKRNGRTLWRRVGFWGKVAIRRLLSSHDHDGLFDSIDRTTAYAHWRTLLRQSEITADRDHGPHCMRRTGVSTIKAAGGDAQSFADHASEDTTRRHYYVPHIVDAKPAIRYLFEPFGFWRRLLASLGL